LKVKFKVSIASETWSYSPGQVVDIEDKQAEAFIKGGIAERVEIKEKATSKAQEKAEKRKKG
jgi:hypothetical protein